MLTMYIHGSMLHSERMSLRHAEPRVMQCSYSVIVRAGPRSAGHAIFGPPRSRILVACQAAVRESACRRATRAPAPGRFVRAGPRPCAWGIIAVGRMIGKRRVFVTVPQCFTRLCFRCEAAARHLGHGALRTRARTCTLSRHVRGAGRRDWCNTMHRCGTCVQPSLHGCLSHALDQGWTATVIAA